MMDREPTKGTFCDMSRPKVTPSVDAELAKKAFKLNIKSSIFSTSSDDASTAQIRKQLSQPESAQVQSPLSPSSGK